MKYWQIATGAEGRNYKSLCLRYGVAFVGGPKNKERMIKEVKAGHVIVLKHGTKELIAVGIVRQDAKEVKDKEWLRDLDGWGADAYCRVNWKLPESIPELELPDRGFTRTTIQLIDDSKIRAAAKRILEEGKSNKSEDEPLNPESIDVDRLVESTVSDRSLHDDLKNRINKIIELAKYYQGLQWGKGNIPRGGEIREHEIRTFLVIPLLLSLGWSEKRLKIELSCKGSRKRVDIACFRNEYKGKPDDCVVVVETKKFISGLDYAKDQALSYQKFFPSCRSIVVTNGYCYKIFEKEGEGKKFRNEPSAYLNLLNPTEKYPLDLQVGGACDALEWLLPNKYA